MNIRHITNAQQPLWDPFSSRYMNPTPYFKEYVAFCMSRRSYKRGKGLTRSMDFQRKLAAKDRVYAAKCKKRAKGGILNQ